MGTAIKATAGTLVVFAAVAAFGAMAFVSAGYRYADGFPLAQVGALDELYKLGPALGAVAKAGLVIATATAAATLVALVIPRTRAWAWVVPLVGAAAWIAATMIGAANFQPPPPDLGG